VQTFPKQTKYKKEQKGKNFKKISKNFELFVLKKGSIGLKSMSSGRISSKHIEAFKSVINKIVKKIGKLVVNIFPFTPITKKPLEIRMGKGKGAVDSWVFKVKAGVMLCEIETGNLLVGKKALKAAQYRLPIRTKIII